jgi:hypothetical protein
MSPRVWAPAGLLPLELFTVKNLSPASLMIFAVGVALLSSTLYLTLYQ